MTTDLTALPPERLGQLLRGARRHATLSRRRAANIAAVSRAMLIAIERGWERPSQATLAALLSAYDQTPEQLLPPRSPLVIDGTSLALTNTSQVHIVASTARDDLLRGYIKLVTEARDNGSLESLSLRSTDVQSLAAALGTDDNILTDRIMALLDCNNEEAVTIGRLLRTFAGPVLGVAFSVTVIGGSIVAGNTSGARLLPASADTPQSAEVAPEVGTVTSSGPATTTSSTIQTPDIGLLPGEAPTLIFEG